MLRMNYSRFGNCFACLAIAGTLFTPFATFSQEQKLSTRPPKLLDPKVAAADKVSEACRLVAEYALTVEGVKQIGKAGQVTKAAANKWTVQYDKQGYKITIYAFAKGESFERGTSLFDRVDSNENGKIDTDEFLKKAVRTYCQESRKPHVEDHTLKDAADLLRRIDKRIAAMKEEFPALALWNEPIKTVKRQVFDKTYIDPVADASGKLLQCNYIDLNRRHRLVYRGGCEKKQSDFSIRVVAASTGAIYSMVPPHVSYRRAWFVFEQLPADKKLQAKLLHIIQEEAFKEPGNTGIERRAWLAAMALAHLAKSGEFPDLRWDRSSGPGLSMQHEIMRDKDRLILLCDTMNPKVGFNPSLPVAITVSRSKKEVE